MLNPLKLGIAGGILGALTMFIFTILAVYTGYAVPFLSLMTSVYPGYSISLVGSFVGLVYGFIDSFVCLFLLAWIYNKLNFG